MLALGSIDILWGGLSHPETHFVLRLFRSAPKPTPASTGDRLVYAVGDIHGRADLLEGLLARIVADAGPALARGERPLLVFLGDYVDRGADSRGVIDRLIALAAQPGFEVRLLMGNHEEAMLGFLEDPVSGAGWLDFGGGATLASYGVAPPIGRSSGEELAALSAALSAVLPAAHLTFLRSLELAVVLGDYVFVHAGLRPGVPLHAQSARDLLWIRQEFLSEKKSFEKVVVHGHTPEEMPYDGPTRIGLDTGAYATGVLTAGRLLGAERAFLQYRHERKRG